MNDDVPYETWLAGVEAHPDVLVSVERPAHTLH